MGAALPAALICLITGLMLALQPLARAAIGIALVFAAAVVVHALPLGASAERAVDTGCWLSLLAVAAMIYLPRAVPPGLALLLAANAGGWAGAVIAAAGTDADLARSLPLVLVTLPAAWVAARGWKIALQVVASWLVAVSLLAARAALFDVASGLQARSHGIA